MAKKQKVEEIVSTVPIDYIKLVDDMNDQAFQFCIEYLYPLFRYRVLQQSDMRKVDLKEALLGIKFYMPKDEKGRKLEGLNAYVFILKLYFDSFLKCKAGSSVEKYRNRAIELMEHALGEDGVIEDIEDAVLIFIALFRVLSDDFEHVEKYTITGFRFDVFKEDAEMLKTMREHKTLVPNGIVDKHGIINRIFGTEYEERSVMKYAYMNNVLFLCRCLQNRGVFSVEDE